jgi:hypothetical protein
MRKTSEAVLVFHENAQHHTTAHTRVTLCELKFEVLHHPAYSPDIVTSDLHLFKPLQAVFRGH